MARAKFTSDGDHVCWLDIDIEGEDRQSYCYWAPQNGGYIHKVTDTQPGTLGQQVCEGLYGMGNTLYWGGPGKGTVEDIIRREWKRRKRTK